MAKGDAAGGAKSASGTGVPKQDQYSVMHSILDNLGGSIAPSVMPGRDVRNPADFANINPNGAPSGNINIGGMNSPLTNMGGAAMGGRFGAMNGVTGGAPSIAPNNPQDMMRRTMMGKGVYGQ
jgi:hypothetical protein